MDYIELFQRRIDESYIVNLMRATNMEYEQAQDKIRFLFPMIRGA